jgi:hypothetical protein
LENCKDSFVVLEKKAFLLCSYAPKRKNFMFSNTPRGARGSAIIYSIIETAKANNLKPYNYLQYLFEQLP